MKTILFDEDALGWTRDKDRNLTFLKHQADYLNIMHEYRGYTYLNQIYEHLGVTWNPDNENVCYTKENGPIGVEILPMGETSFIIGIH